MKYKVQVQLSPGEDWLNCGNDTVSGAELAEARAKVKTLNAIGAHIGLGPAQFRLTEDVADDA